MTTEAEVEAFLAAAELRERTEAPVRTVWASVMPRFPLDTRVTAHSGQRGTVVGYADGSTDPTMEGMPIVFWDVLSEDVGSICATPWNLRELKDER